MGPAERTRRLRSPPSDDCVPRWYTQDEPQAGTRKERAAQRIHVRETLCPELFDNAPKLGHALTKACGLSCVRQDFGQFERVGGVAQIIVMAIRAHHTLNIDRVP